MLGKIQAILLCWFALQQQTSTLTWQKFVFFMRNLVQNLIQLVLFLKAMGKGQKIVKSKVVQKNANWRRSETNGYETGQDSAGVPRRGFFHPFFILFHFFLQNIENESISGSKFSFINP